MNIKKNQKNGKYPLPKPLYNIVIILVIVNRKKLTIVIKN